MKIKGKMKLIGFLKPAASFLFWILVWQLAAVWVDRQLLIPKPAAVMHELCRLIITYEFWKITMLSFIRILCGFAAGVAIGVLLAVLTVFIPVFDWLISPLIRMIRAVPVASFIILLLLWIYYSFVPVLIAVFMVVPLVWANVSTGIRAADQNLLELCKSFHFTKRKTLSLLYVPTVCPYFYSACITALGTAWKSGIAAEVLCLPKYAIGTRLYYSKIYIETPQLFAWTIVVILMSYLVEQGITALFRAKLTKQRGISF